MTKVMRKPFASGRTKIRSLERSVLPEHVKSERLMKCLESDTLSWYHLIEVLPDGIAFVDEEGVIRLANEHLAALSGYSRDELIGQDVKALITSWCQRTRASHRGEFAAQPRTKEIGSLDLALLCRDGSELAIDVALSPFDFSDQAWVIAVIRDKSSEREAEQVRRETEERFRLAFEGNVAPMTFTDLDDRILAVNDAFCSMVGFDRKELLGGDSKLFTFPEDVGVTEETLQRVISGDAEQVRYSKRYLRKDGKIISVEVSRSPARDAAGNIHYFVFSERDITEELALADQLSFQTLNDTLTELSNRTFFMGQLSQARSRVIRQDGMAAVFLLDLDDFQAANDTLGHLVGDQLLVMIARRLEGVTRASDTLCRFGGDEFLYLAEGLASVAEAEQVAERLLGVFSEPLIVAGKSIEQLASIGIVVWDATGGDVHEIIQDADVALYEAKREGRGRYVLFTPEMHHQTANRFALTQELRHALCAGELSMHYQPIVNLGTTEVVGFEALMRWQHPERGSVPPSVFIPLAERSDLIIELGAFALLEAVEAASTWERIGAQTSQPYVMVNFSARQFRDPGLVAMIEQALVKSGLEPERLIVEITESVTLFDVTETLRVMERLSRLGIGVALDDFGTGYSSLSYLTLLRPQIIKIDQSFVSSAHESDDDETLLEAIVSLGQNLNIIVLAEGIETSGQLVRLRQLGCELGQGFLFSPAVPADDALTLVGRVLGS
jgi:diguanylate cyclase (GGDEF)-like protein/PAS domain S-box-containing protein